MRLVKGEDAEPTWVESAVCASVDPELFFLVDSNSVRQAKAVCKGCPVQTECLTETMENEILTGVRFGVFGGLAPDERKKLGGTRPPGRPRAIGF